jgi:hypothetical protein
MSFDSLRTTFLGFLIATASATCAAQTLPDFMMTTPDYQVIVSKPFWDDSTFVVTQSGPGVLLSNRLKAVDFPEHRPLPSFEVTPRGEARLGGAIVMNLGELIFTEMAGPISQAFLRGSIIADGEVIDRFDYALTRNAVVEYPTLNAGYFSLETEPVLIPTFRHLSVADLWLDLYPSDGGAIFSTGSAEFILSLYVGEVPEPASALMLAAGLAIIGWRRKFNRIA